MLNAVLLQVFSVRCLRHQDGCLGNIARPYCELICDNRRVGMDSCAFTKGTVMPISNRQLRLAATGKRLSAAGPSGKRSFDHLLLLPKQRERKSNNRSIFVIVCLTFLLKQRIRKNEFSRWRLKADNFQHPYASRKKRLQIPGPSRVDIHRSFPNRLRFRNGNWAFISLTPGSTHPSCCQDAGY